MLADLQLGEQGHLGQVNEVPALGQQLPLRRGSRRPTPWSQSAPRPAAPPAPRTSTLCVEHMVAISCNLIMWECSMRDSTRHLVALTLYKDPMRH